ncbi:type II 3-dehydroquinate dehydratase [Candidatus Marinimicrobia bacterium MT.SAG.3]|nr:type II 3-dehydroquinate dehydratase [Candidatus Marinimicrobia bacterium MT.SAG.3]
MKTVVVINGPNLNLLGEREPEIYGSQTLEELNREIEEYAKGKDVELKFFQSNHEGEIIDLLHKFRNGSDGFILNPGAFTHYSYAIRDAVAAVSPPVVEVHLSDISSREEFRKISVIEPVAAKQFSGEGIGSYLKAIDFLLSL